MWCRLKKHPQDLSVLIGTFPIILSNISTWPPSELEKKNVHTRTFWDFWNVFKSVLFSAKGNPKKMHQYTVLLIIGRPINRISILNTSSVLNLWSSILILVLNTSSILNLELPILNSYSKIATKVRDLRPKMSSKVRDSGQNVRMHRVQLFPALMVGCQWG